jgi:hypothetical protein
MLEPASLQRIFPLLAVLPPDASDSVAALYEALAFISDLVAPDYTWKAQALATGFLQPNVLARVYHTYAVSLILSNYRRLCLVQKPPSELALIEEKDSISSV